MQQRDATQLRMLPFRLRRKCGCRADFSKDGFRVIKVLCLSCVTHLSQHLRVYCVSCVEKHTWELVLRRDGSSAHHA